MVKRTLGEVSRECRQRLITHYGTEVSGWLDAVPALLDQAAERWKLTLGGYHDAGHASVIATAATLDGRPLLLKAWADPARFHNEVSALRLWAGGPTVDVVEVADDLAVAALEMISGQPGGGERPRRELQTVAAALQGLHTFGRLRRRPRDLPLLATYLHQEVRPRIWRRLESVDLGSWHDLANAILPELMTLEEDDGRATVLHADLYRENVLFDWLGHPRFIDPLPMVGDAAFDWAFWTVYYDLGHGTDARLATAARITRIPVPVLAPWCRALAVDGLLYYLETADPRAPRMAEVLAWLSAPTPGNRP
ncbi:streptomycin 6-kinase [Streptomyces africanus]|uniref:Streptomycin 6-kinase n=1 Tax=Streptomyces africanus TaxID=231024 RepID=A0ABU0QS20_9ACTN|nr:aminoglycoside phosphotransferase family protein [Streptomyces africanus]MDQ0750189.1 streptomycin 6-kinase [Streptomyces africanus]